jgi:hypothetical protein
METINASFIVKLWASIPRRPLACVRKQRLGIISLIVVFVLPSSLLYARNATSLADTKAALLNGTSHLDHISEYVVATSEDFQASLIAANPGDLITLKSGMVFGGNFFLPNKATQGVKTNWITIRASAVETLPPEGVRATPDYSNAMARLESPNSQPALITQPGAHHYRFEGIELTIAPDVRLNHGIVVLGEGTETDASLLPHDIVIDRCYVHGNATADVSRGIALNCASTDIVNSYISDCHGLGFDTQAIAGWNGPGPFRIVNNYLEASGENIIFGGADPVIQGLVPSDIEFTGNLCSKPLSWMQGILARPERVLAQGASVPGNLEAGATYYYRVSVLGPAGYSTVANSAASDETAATLGTDQTAAIISWDPVEHASDARIYRTADPPTTPVRKWASYTSGTTSFTDLGDAAEAHSVEAPPERGTRWSVKNLLELKNARRVTIEGNVFEDNWVDAQSGFAIQITVRNQDGKAGWSTIEDVSFTNNLVRHAAAGINLLGRDDINPSEQLKRVEISNNVFDDLGGNKWGGNGRFLQITQTLDVAVDRNTIFQTGNIITAYGIPNQGFVFSNNIAPHNEYGIIGDGSSLGLTTIDQYFPQCLLKRNVIIGGPGSKYPKKNFFPGTVGDVGFVDQANGNYQLSDTSPYKKGGTKKRDIGADFQMVMKSARRAIQGSP